jgi:hypothetical protein
MTSRLRFTMLLSSVAAAVLVSAVAEHPIYAADCQWFRGSETAMSTRSHCCHNAKVYVDNACVDYGGGNCSEYTLCDSFCAIGDYLCWTCGINGKRCKPAPSTEPEPPKCGEFDFCCLYGCDGGGT